jgi:hypothetical protein
MGWFDWLFGRKKKARQGSTTTAAPNSQVVTPIEDDDEHFAQATTFMSRRLSPIAQREIKNLRNMLAQSVQLYDWQGGNCADAKKLANAGPFRVGDGLTGQAPVPGREGCAKETCSCFLAAHQS